MSHDHQRDGGPAYPLPSYESGVGHHGMSLRAYFFCEVSGAMISRIPGKDAPRPAELLEILQLAFKMAERMVETEQGDH